MKFHFCQNDRYEIHTRTEFQTHTCIKRNIQRVYAIHFVLSKLCSHENLNDGLEFHFGQNDGYEIHTVLSFISSQFM